LLPGAIETSTASSGPAASVATEVMVTNFRSAPRLASSAWSSGAAWMVTAACSEAPMRPSARTSSMRLLTSSRISRMRLHLASSAGASPGAGMSQKVSVKMEGERPGANTCQASSAVKLRNGAIQRSMAWVRCHSAVWALRRARLLAGVTYRRSLSTSR